MKKSLLLLIAALILIALSFFLDGPVHAFLAVHRFAGLIKLSRAASKYGDWSFLMLACLACLLIANACQNEKWKRLLITMMIVASLAGLTADVIRSATGRARPNSGVAAGWYGVRHGSKWLIVDTRYNSFPSGHTAAAMGLVAPLILLRRRVGWLLLPVAVAVSVSRLVLEAHHFSDVFASTLLAFGVAAWWLRYGAARVPTSFRPPIQLKDNPLSTTA